MSSLPTVFFSEDPVVSFRFVDLTPPFCAWFRLPFSTRGMPATDSSHLRAPCELCSCPGRLHVSHEWKRRIPLPYVLLFVAIVIYISYKKIYRRILHENLRASFAAFASWQTANNVPAESMWAMETWCKGRGGSRIFFLGGGALVSCSTSTPISHIVFFFGTIPVLFENRRSSQGGGVRTPCTLPLDPPLRGLLFITSNESATFLGYFLKPQVAQARNMSIGEHRLSMRNIRNIRICMGKKTYRFCNLRKWKDFNKKKTPYLT